MIVVFVGFCLILNNIQATRISYMSPFKNFRIKRQAGLTWLEQKQARILEIQSKQLHSGV